MEVASTGFEQPTLQGIHFAGQRAEKDAVT
jgi:hypothetical protein